jgi:hypothetical protein
MTEPMARAAVMDWGCSNVSGLSQGVSGSWFGECQKGGQTFSVMVDKNGKVSQGSPSHITEGEARAALADAGCSNISKLTRGPNGRWQGSCQKGGNTVQATVDQSGKIALQ